MIAYKCGQCQAEMESPDVMKVEVCPSCGTLNRVPSASRFGGTVRCARCQKDFSKKDTVKLYNRELVCDKCATFLEDIEKVVLPVATEVDLAAPPFRSLFSGPLGCLAVSFFLAIPCAIITVIFAIKDTLPVAIEALTEPSRFLLIGDLMYIAGAVWCVIISSSVLWLSVLFFRQKRRSPIVIAALFLVQGVCGFLVILFGLFTLVMTGGRGADRDFIWIFGGAVALTAWGTLWALYFRSSERVKETFVK
jgi:DNA-directed RNA polymerase subunit RPC12/RpoP